MQFQNHQATARFNRRIQWGGSLAILLIFAFVGAFLVIDQPPSFHAMLSFGQGTSLAALPLFSGIVRPMFFRDADKPGTGGGNLGDAEFKTQMLGFVKDIKSSGEEAKAKIGTLETELATAKKDLTEAKTEFGEVAKQLAEVKKSALSARSQPRTILKGRVSDDCAMALSATFIAHVERSGKMEALSTEPRRREALISEAKNALGISAKAALTTADQPLPVVYSGEIRELISQFGVVRKKMFPYPIGMGTAKPARMGTRPAFGSIAMSAAFSEKSPTVTFASLESHKIGGLVRVPREIDEQSVVAMGQYLARYGALEFARAEDAWGFLADGSGTYESVKGIVQIARDNARTVVLAAGKTKPSDATLDDFRALRRQVNKAALSGNLSAYYLDTTWETRLSAFKTQQEPLVYQRLPDGSAILDGYPIVWTDVLTPYGTAATVDSPIAVFGALDFWWMGEHGSPRIDTSEHVFFANDQLATRFIEEIDFDYCAADATAALLTAAA